MLDNRQGNYILPITLFMLILTALELFIVNFFGLRSIVLAVIVANFLLAIFWIHQIRMVRVKRQTIIHEVNEKADDTLNSLLTGLPVGVIRYDKNKFTPSWYNSYIDMIFTAADSSLSSDQIKKIIDQVHKEVNPSFDFDHKKYAIVLDEAKSIIYLMDASAELSLRAGQQKSRPIIGLISVDNYDDATDSVTETERSQINGFIVNFLDNFARDHMIYLRRLQSDRFVFFGNYQSLSNLVETKFRILDRFKEEAEKKDLPLALSVGVSYGEDDFTSIGKTAILNLDLALVRGGDQAVVKESDDLAKAMYFGGNSESRPGRVRTRARAIAATLRNIISEVDQVFIVGHQNSDLDALGAGVAMRNFVQANGKTAYVIYDADQLLPDVGRAITKLYAEGGEGYEGVIPLPTAKKKKTANSLLIMVDHSKISQTLSQEFFESFNQVVIIDHHRRDEDFPANTMFNYIESGASSASEMAVELLQFQTTASKLMTPVEASVILAGISVDTNSFTKGTTQRTFEAASYLRANKADNDLIRHFLATDFEEYKQVQALVLSAEILDRSYAIAMAREEDVTSSLVASKAADSLLNMEGVYAAFVLTKNKQGQVAISARSLSPFNSQALMESMGGGGHFSAAATQVSGKSMEEVKRELIQLIRQKKKESTEEKS